MTRSPLLDSFDPFATHPFTNNSGLTAPPPQPSQYPIPIPSPRAQSHFQPMFSTSPSSTASPSSLPSLQGYSPSYSSQAVGRGVDSSSPTKPIFVPFRQETSSPDLILKKKPVNGSPSSGQKKS